MTPTENIKHTVAVLRGGNISFSQSIKEGEDMLNSLESKEFKVLDVLIHRDGSWSLKGVPTDPHYIFTVSSFIVDTTHSRNSSYQILAKKMNVPFLFSHAEDISLDREDTYRILRQEGINVPLTSVIRSISTPENSYIHHIWNTHHTPLLLRPLSRSQDTHSKLVRGFKDFTETLEEYINKGVDIQVLTYKQIPTYSVAVVPSFRDKELYFPLWVRTSIWDSSIPHRDSLMQQVTTLTSSEKEKMIETVENVCKALNINTPACVDVISVSGKHIVVNVDRTPSLRKDGRFMQSLETTGVDIAEYIASKLYEKVR